jgi:hypothetical protein
MTVAFFYGWDVSNWITLILLSWGPVQYKKVVEADIFLRLIKNAQMQGARNPEE